jgi:hypothetical protein
METALFAKVQSQTQNIGIILDHIQDTRMMLRPQEEVPHLITWVIGPSTTILIDLNDSS